MILLDRNYRIRANSSGDHSLEKFYKKAVSLEDQEKANKKRIKENKAPVKVSEEIWNKVGHYPSVDSALKAYLMHRQTAMAMDDIYHSIKELFFEVQIVKNMLKQTLGIQR